MPRPRPVLGTAALAALLLVDGCASPFADWTIHESRHVRLWTDTPAQARPVIERAELAWAGQSSSFHLRHDMAKVDVLAVSPERFRGWFGDAGPTAVAIGKLPGNARFGARGVIVAAWSEDPDGEAVTRRDDGVAHAVSHLLLEAQHPRAAPWLHEALATYAERFEVAKRGDALVACYGIDGPPPKGPPPPLVPVVTLFGATDDALADPSRRGPLAHTARTLIDDLLLAEDGRLRPVYGSIVAASSAGLPAGLVLGRALQKLGPPEIDVNAHLAAHEANTSLAPRPPCPLAWAIPRARMPDVLTPARFDAAPGDVRDLIDGVDLVANGARGRVVCWVPPPRTAGTRR